MRDIVVVALLALSGGALGTAGEGSAGASFSTMLAAGQRALGAGRYDGALRQGRGLVAIAPKRYEGYRLVAMASLGLDLPDRADQAFRQAIRLAPPAAQPALRSGLREVAALRQALRETSRAGVLKASGDLGAAAEAQESAYQALPSRVAFGITAVELFASAGRLEEAQRLLDRLRQKPLPASSSGHLLEREAALQARIVAARQSIAKEIASKETAAKKAEDDRFEAERRERVAARRAQEAERKRSDAAKEADRLAEEERQRAEKERLDREETDRLNGILDGLRRTRSDAEDAERRAREAVEDAERAVRKLDGEEDGARDRRDRAKHEKEEKEGKLRDAKGDLSRQIAQNDLRGAENAYNDAKDEYDKVHRRLDDAKSRRDQAQSDVDDAHRKLEQARQGVRDTEAAIQKIANGG